MSISFSSSPPAAARAEAGSALKQSSSPADGAEMPVFAGLIEAKQASGKSPSPQAEQPPEMPPEEETEENAPAKPDTRAPEAVLAGGHVLRAKANDASMRREFGGTPGMNAEMASGKPATEEGVVVDPGKQRVPREAAGRPIMPIATPGVSGRGERQVATRGERPIAHLSDRLQTSPEPAPALANDKAPVAVPARFSESGRLVSGPSARGPLVETGRSLMAAAAGSIGRTQSSESGETPRRLPGAEAGLPRGEQGKAAQAGETLPGRQVSAFTSLPVEQAAARIPLSGSGPKAAIADSAEAGSGAGQSRGEQQQPEKSSANTPPAPVETQNEAMISRKMSLQATYGQQLGKSTKANGTASADDPLSMLTRTISEGTESGVTLPAQAGSVNVAMAERPEAVQPARPSTMQALLEQVQQQVSRLTRSGGGQFDLQWGDHGLDRVQVQVSLREGHWRVDFRTANAELGRFLEREYSQSHDSRGSGSREGEVHFHSDDSRDRRHNPEQDQAGRMDDEWQTFMRLIRNRRAGNARPTAHTATLNPIS